ncbi:hypothetical protein HZB97_03975 [Candidatus Gottesmanbacteria bacterium]|nr:hypothetical protein [Candidatus Gottesmanbacteria bacterium]
MSRKSVRFGLNNNLPLLLAILAVVFIVPLVILSAVGNVYFRSNSQTSAQETIINRAEVGTVVSQPASPQAKFKPFLLKSTLGHSYKLISTNLNVPVDLSGFVGQSVLIEGYVQGVNFFANAISPARLLQNGFKAEGFVLDSGDKSLTKEAIYYFSGSKNDLKTGYFITSYPDRLSALAGLKVQVSGSVWTTPILNKPLINALDLAPLAVK